MQNVHSSDTAAGFWLPLSELARSKGVSKQALSKRVDRLESLGHLTTRPGERGTKLVNVAEFDRAAGKTVDAVRALNGGAPQPPAPVVTNPGDPVLAKEQARRAAYDADLKQLDLEERLGKLLPVDQVRDAMATCAESLVRGIDGITTRADDLAEAVGKEGAAGARRVLKTIAHDLRATLARSMTLLGDAGDDTA